MDTYLTYFDMFRYISGLLVILFALCHGILPGRPRYRMRIGLCFSAAVLAAMAYVPLSRLVLGLGMGQLYASVLYWIGMSLLPVVITRLCWEALPAGILFRVILCESAENFMTAVTYYLFSKSLFPGFDGQHPLPFMLVTVCLQGGMLLIGWFVLRPRVSEDENGFYQTPGKTAAGYLIAYVSIYIMFSATKLCFEMILPDLSRTPEYAGIHTFLKYYLTLNLILLSVAVSFIMISAYQALTLLNEKQIVTRMLKERQGQYEFARENSEMIKQLAHNLKHQLRALRSISGNEREERIAEAERSVDFYDAVVRTGNEALDTILTEKSIYCRNRGIRLSCTVSSRLLEKIGVVDLYTLLGNALDNSIEAVSRLSDPEKKTISLDIRDQDQMLFIQLENYYEGSVRMEDGLPLTTKEDEQMHGYGTRSIRAIVKSYGGAVMVRTEDQIFSLEILIPM